MAPISKFSISRVLLVAAILLIVAFQSYWLRRLYKEEWQALKKETNGIFRDVVYKMQVDRFKADTLIYKQTSGENLFVYNAVNALRRQNADLKKNSNGIQKDSSAKISQTFFFNKTNDSMHPANIRRIELHKNELPPEIAKMLANQQIGRVQLPPTMDTGLIRRMSQSGVKVVVSFNGKLTDSGFRSQNEKNEIPQPPAVPTRPQRLIIRSNPPAALAVTNLTIKNDNLPSEKSFVRMITSGKALDDTLPIRKLDSIYQKELAKAGIPISFQIIKGKEDSLHRKDTMTTAQLATSPAIVGFIQPYWYQAGFENPAAFLLKKISLQILFSMFLVAFTTVTFIFLYRNLVIQRKLTGMKNDFISNITHELKTPLATVTVAVEALRNFGGIQNPERTKEYLDISAAELQRLSLLVDKVLKLSLFENRELELKKEVFDLKQLTEEVLNTMKLQFSTHQARIDLQVEGSYFTILADRLHITSVIFNLLDNALKYSKGTPDIRIRLQHQVDSILLQVSDKGIGIAPDYKAKIFDKFFRVPSGDHHNIKGYGLGLSYVAHVIKQHGGSIAVESELGKGSTFTVKLPVT